MFDTHPRICTCLVASKRVDRTCGDVFLLRMRFDDDQAREDLLCCCDGCCQVYCCNCLLSASRGVSNEARAPVYDFEHTHVPGKDLASLCMLRCASLHRQRSNRTAGGAPHWQCMWYHLHSRAGVLWHAPSSALIVAE